MGKFIDLTGQRFGRLTVIERAGSCKYKKGSAALWLCLCDCGNKTVVRGTSLRTGHTYSCGCAQKTAVTKHGAWRSRIYRIYWGMKSRCYNTKEKDYPNYGGRGITICDEWLNDFMSFYTWAMANGYDDTKSIDRIDNDKGYSPDNCRWVDNKTQCNNRSNNTRLEHNGKNQTIAEWADEVKLSTSVILARLKLGWTVEATLTKPKRKRST